MDDFAGCYSLNCDQEFSEDGLIEFHSVPVHVNDHDSERNLLEVVLKFETLIDGD